MGKICYFISDYTSRLVTRETVFPGLVSPAIALVIAFATVLVDQWGVLSRLDNLVYDTLIIASSRSPSKDIAIIAIDEKSLEELGRWPWPRERHIQLLRKLAPLKHSVTGFDILLSEPDDNPGTDEEFARVIADNGRIVLPVAPVKDFSTGKIKERTPVPVLEQAAFQLGSVDAELDKDGISRSHFLLSGLSAPVWPSFPLAMLSINQPKIEDNLPGTRKPDDGRLHPGEWVRDYHVLIPFAGSPGNYPTHSYVDVLKGRTDSSVLDKKYLLIGVTAAGIGDKLSTPTTGHNSPMPGVEYMANILDALLNDRMITRVNSQTRLIAVFLLVLLPLLLYSRLTVRLSLIAWISAVALSFLLPTILLYFRLWLEPASAILANLIAFPVWAWWHLKVSDHRIDEVMESHSATMNAVDHGVIILNTNWEIEHMNAQAEQLTDCTLGNVINQPLTALLPDILITPGNDNRRENTQTESTAKLPKEYQLKNQQGKLITTYLHVNPVSDRWGSSRGYVLNVALDRNTLFSQKKSSGNSHYDKKTGLYDRTFISRLITRTIRDADDGDELFILNIDIDNLALITETVTKKCTNKVLKTFVNRLASITSDEVSLGRLGIDQLLLLVKENDESAVKAIATDIINQAKLPIKTDDGEVILSINIGISHYPTDGRNARALLKHANFAIRQNESMARSRYKFYSRRDHENSLVDHVIEQGLRKSLEEGSLNLFYQPQINLGSGELLGFEALLRWSGDNSASISTDTAIAIAEQSDLINHIGRWVIKTGCEQMQDWHQNGITGCRLSINLSPLDLEQPDFLKETKAAIQTVGIDPALLEFEITEHCVLKNTSQSINILNTFKEMGSSLAIDDFGTGYSTFNYLKTLPVSTVKIDKSFIENMVEIKDDAFIVQSMISMSHGLGINVIAEGVETVEQARLLNQFGCDHIQGYLASRPIPADEVPGWLKEKCHYESGKYYLQSSLTKF